MSAETIYVVTNDTVGAPVEAFDDPIIARGIADDLNALAAPMRYLVFATTLRRRAATEPKRRPWWPPFGGRVD